MSRLLLAALALSLSGCTTQLPQVPIPKATLTPPENCMADPRGFKTVADGADTKVFAETISENYGAARQNAVDQKCLRDWARNVVKGN